MPTRVYVDNHCNVVHDRVGREVSYTVRSDVSGSIDDVLEKLRANPFKHHKARRESAEVAADIYAREIAEYERRGRYRYKACNPRLLFVMEHMEMSCEALHARKIQMTDNVKLDLMWQMWRGLDYLHKINVAHCDIVSENILLENVDDTERGILIEFHSSRALDNLFRLCF